MQCIVEERHFCTKLCSGHFDNRAWFMTRLGSLRHGIYVQKNSREIQEFVEARLGRAYTTYITYIGCIIYMLLSCHVAMLSCCHVCKVFLLRDGDDLVSRVRLYQYHKYYRYYEYY